MPPRPILTAAPRPRPAIAHDPADNAKWALNELGSIELGDARSNRSMVKVFCQMLSSPGTSIPQCSASVAEAFYRLLDAKTLTESALFELRQQAVLRRALQSSCPFLLAIQDTTTCNFDTHHSQEGLGAICSNQHRADFKGLHVHSTLLTAADEGAIFGLLGSKFHARKASRKEQTRGTRNRDPGAQVLWQGLNKLDIITKVWRRFRSQKLVGKAQARDARRKPASETPLWGRWSAFYDLTVSSCLRKRRRA